VTGQATAKKNSEKRPMRKVATQALFCQVRQLDSVKLQSGRRQDESIFIQEKKMKQSVGRLTRSRSCLAQQEAQKENEAPMDTSPQATIDTSKENAKALARQ
jgi:hypothetical protein